MGSSSANSLASMHSLPREQLCPSAQQGRTPSAPMEVLLPHTATRGQPEGQEAKHSRMAKTGGSNGGKEPPWGSELQDGGGSIRGTRPSLRHPLLFHPGGH